MRELRNYINVPKSISRLHPITREIISLYNLIDIGVNIDDLSVEEAYYLEYYGVRRKNKDERNRFEILSKMLSK